MKKTKKRGPTLKTIMASESMRMTDMEREMNELKCIVAAQGKHLMKLEIRTTLEVELRHGYSSIGPSSSVEGKE